MILNCYTLCKMDVIRNIKSMSAAQFSGLQIFELIYLMTLAFLPFVVAIREVTYAIFAILAVVLFVAICKKCLKRTVHPEGKVVLITGCDSGLGNACARRLDSLGFTVVAACYNTESDGAQRLKEASYGHLHTVKLDITDDNSIKQCLLKVKSLCGQKGLWGIINNAGVASFGDVEISPLESYRQVMEVNLFGTLRMIQTFLPLVRLAKGRIITITGTNGRLSFPGQSAFSMSVHGLEALSDSLRYEMRQFGVKVITVRPGNFAGATGLLNRNGLEKVQTTFEEIKKKTNPEILRSYGKNYLDNQLKQLSELSKSTAGSLASVMDALEDAVERKRPKSVYMVDGGNQLFDLGNVLIRLGPLLPSSLLDYIVRKVYGYKPDR
ncbi:D-beta-hydroxybutyrate dehydrogenase, mitochondrial-like isoform X2 [Physella acuta]|uniref:D-beta-hydroxybutyrate dehydrogenase, mitochondrial-like isoform X2 n=1 Tax=Physella acuta TaxID=109671 RepID=UPI0027DD4A25|nr:D-beta-hydroxybutyrate dehydrogenase, mitochondrial-like isoform X2 [Physella acuta]